MRLLVAHPPGREPERAYAVDTLLGGYLGVEHVTHAEDRADVEIRAADGGPGRVRVADGLLGAGDGAWLTAETLPRTPLGWLDVAASPLRPALCAARLPVLYGRPEVAVCDGTASLGVDVFGAAFFMLTRLEELVCRPRDGHDRFPVQASLAHREGFLRRPIVNELGELLWEALRAVWPRLERRRRASRLLLSHDVDWPRMPRRSAGALGRAVAGDVLRRRDPRLALDRLRAAARPGRRRDPYDTFDFLMDVSERRGVASAFYVQAGTTRPGLDGGYRLDDPWIEGLLRRIHERGHEIGLHPSYDTCRDPALVRTELGTLRETCDRLGIAQDEWGGRQHYLRWENPETWQAWDDAGLDYDSTLGFAAAVGFRTGACFEYHPFNLRTRAPLRLRERPLVVMEASLLQHEQATPEAVHGAVDQLAAACARFGGDLTVLWHNSSLLSRGDRRLYAEVVGRV